MTFIQYHVRAASGDGGITNSVRRLSEGLARTGAKSVIVCADDGPAPDLPGVRWRRVPHRRVGSAILPGRLDDAFADADVVVFNSAWTVHNVAAGRAARRVRVPYVLAPRGAYDPRILRRRPWLKRTWWSLGEAHLVHGAAAIHIFFESEGADIEALGYSGPRLIAPNGVTAPDHIRWGGTGEYLLYLGRFDPEHKGLDTLIRSIAAAPAGALPPLRMHGPDWRGGKDRVRRMVASLGLRDRVVVGDALYGEDKWQTYAGALGFVYPSRWEGFGNSVAEACAIGVPTVVTPYPLGRYLGERNAAFLAEPSVDGLLDGLLRVVSADAARVGAQAAELVRREFTWDAVARSWQRQVAAWI